MRYHLHNYGVTQIEVIFQIITHERDHWIWDANRERICYWIHTVTCFNYDEIIFLDQKIQIDRIDHWQQYAFY